VKGPEEGKYFGTMLYKLLVAALLVSASAFAPPMTRVGVARCSVRMEEKAAKKAKKEEPPPKPKAPGEGDPFGAVAQAFSEANKDGGSAFQPRGISDANVIDCYQTYIESDDEPWHATCKGGTVLGIEQLAASKPETVVEVEAAAPPKPGGMNPGWTEKRVVAPTHDNSR